MAKYTRFYLEERIKLEVYRLLKWTFEEIGKGINRSKSSIRRELSRYPGKYAAFNAHELAIKRNRDYNSNCKIADNPLLFKKIHELLKKRWSPEQISTYLSKDYSEFKDMQISHESIYSFIYILPRGELRKELIGYLRQKKKKRNSRIGEYSQRGKIPDMISIEERPAKVESRSVAGHWEGDLIMGKDHKSAMGTIVERKTRSVQLVKLKNKDAASVRKAFENEVKTLPEQMKLSLTYDQGKGMTEHKLFTKNTNIKVHFFHPSSPWERSTNENKYAHS